MWIEETSKFIYEIQTPEERLRTKLAKQFSNDVVQLIFALVVDNTKSG